MASPRLFGMWYHPLYTDGIHPEARFPRDRYQLLLDRLQASEAKHQMTFNQPNPIARELLLLAHDGAYVDRFLAGELTDKEEKRIGLTPWTPAMIERTQVLMGGAVEATTHALQHGGITGNMAGGTHHAHRDFGSGYCVFNDLAVCALHALENLNIERVAIVDDVISTGGTLAAVLQGVERAGASVTSVVTVVEKGEGMTTLKEQFPETAFTSLVTLRMDGANIIVG